MIKFKKKILVCSYSHKSYFSSNEINKEIVKSLKYPKNKIKTQSMSDGGEGLSEIFNWRRKIKLKILDAELKKKNIVIHVKRKTALIEVSKIIGGFEKKIQNGMYRSSFGIGLLILKLEKLGIKKFIIGFGGSTVSDFGIGLASALGIKFYDRKKNLISIENNNLNAFSLKKIYSISLDHFFLKKNKLKFLLLSDSKVKLTGINGQVSMFANQKGIVGKNKLILKKGFENFKKILEKKFYKKIDLEHMGAGGGTLAMIYCLFKSKLYSGDKYVQNKIKLSNKILRNDIIISGEGILDKSSKTKGIWNIITNSKKLQKKLILIVGKSKISIKKNIKIIELFKNKNVSISKKIILKKIILLCKNIELDRI